MARLRAGSKGLGQELADITEENSLLSASPPEAPSEISSPGSPAQIPTCEPGLLSLEDSTESASNAMLTASLARSRWQTAGQGVAQQTQVGQRKRLGKSLLDLLPVMSLNTEAAKCASCRSLRARALELNLAAQFAAASTRNWHNEANEARRVQHIQDRAYVSQTQMADELRAQLLMLNTHVVEQQAELEHSRARNAGTEKRISELRHETAEDAHA